MNISYDKKFLKFWHVNMEFDIFRPICSICLHYKIGWFANHDNTVCKHCKKLGYTKEDLE
jgi:hypothetical protein